MMRYGTVTGVKKPVSRLVQGTMPIGMKDLDAAFALLDSVRAAGGNTFDSAHIYGGGDCERALGRWIRARNCRDEVVILTKGCHHNADRKRVTPFDIEADLHDSLARLQVDYIDIYLLHRDDPAVPVGPIVEALNAQRRAGLIHAFGGSNWTHGRIQEANEYARAHGLVPFAASSPQFSLAAQRKEPWAECVTISGPQNAEARRFYQESQIAVFAWSSLAGGFFSGRITRENAAEFDDYFMKLAVECYGSEENFRRLDRAREVAESRGCSAAQIALAWLMGQPMNLFALVGCRTGEEFRQNAEALEIELTPREMAYLNLEAESAA